MQKENPFNLGYYTSGELKDMGFKFVGNDVIISKGCNIIGPENISIGDNVRIDHGVTIACSSGYLKVGSYVHIGGGCYLACGSGVELGNFCGLSQDVKIYSVSDDYSGSSLTNPTVPAQFLNVTTKAVTLGRHVIIGSGSVVFPGVDIGDGSAVGALSLVSRSLNEWGVYFGTPAKKLKSRKRDLLSQEQTLLSQRTRPLPVL